MKKTFRDRRDKPLTRGDLDEFAVIIIKAITKEIERLTTKSPVFAHTA